MESTFSWGRSAAAVSVIGAIAMASGMAGAKDLPEFFVIEKSNYDQVRSDTFEGNKIGDLLPERLEWQIRDWNLKIQLQKPTNIRADPRLWEWTEKYKGTVSIDPNTFLLSNYKAGIPFPDIDPNDPLAGVKIVWNYTYGQPHGDHFFCPFTNNLIDADQGLERSQHWVFARYYFTSRISSPQHIVGDGTVYHKSLLFAEFPQDIKGLGTFSIRYNDPKFDDVWAYIRTVRRIRRLSGGAWMDPIGGTDQLQDDIETFNAHPAWYKGYKLLGKRKALAVADSMRHLPLAQRMAWNRNGTTLPDQYPRMDMENWPHWNPKDVWQPRDIWVVEAQPPEYHPYSRKVNYFDVENYRPYFMEGYDRKGDFWKWATFSAREWVTTDGYIDPATGGPVNTQFSGWGVNIDFQRRHATFFNVPADCDMNPPGYGPDDWTLARLEAAGR